MLLDGALKWTVLVTFAGSKVMPAAGDNNTYLEEIRRVLQ
jgi:hypothetical protein